MRGKEQPLPLIIVLTPCMSSTTLPFIVTSCWFGDPNVSAAEMVARDQPTRARNRSSLRMAMALMMRIVTRVCV